MKSAWGGAAPVGGWLDGWVRVRVDKGGCVRAWVSVRGRGRGAGGGGSGHVLCLHITHAITRTTSTHIHARS